MEEDVIPLRYKDIDLTVSVSLRRKSQKWLVALHGIQSNKALFGNLFIQPFLDDFSLLAIDFVGFGKSSKPEQFSYEILDQAIICQKIIIQ